MSTQRYCVIRKFKTKDSEVAQKLIKEAAMETVGEYFKRAIFSEAFPQIALVLMGLSFILLGIPLQYCLASLPMSVLILYGVIYLGHVYKCMELHDDMSWIPYAYMKNEDTCFWVAEVYDLFELTPLAAELNRINNIPYQFVHLDDLGVLAENFQGLTRTVVGTVAITRSNTHSGRAWLRRMCVRKEYRRRGIATNLLEVAIKFCKTQDYDGIELVTTECHYQARELYIKRGFEPIQNYFKSYLNVKQPMYKYLMHLPKKQSKSDKSELYHRGSN